MAPLNQDALAANIVGSLQKYEESALEAALATTHGLPTLDYGGGDQFQDGALHEWIQVRVVGPARPASMSGPYAPRVSAGNTRGAEIYWILNINCFVRPAKQVPLNNIRIWHLRDIVLGAFAEGTLIPVKAWANTQEHIGNIIVDEILEDRPVSDPERSDLVQHNIVLALRWSETWVADL